VTFNSSGTLELASAGGATNHNLLLMGVGT
jgi:hypothetical protein